MLNHQYADTPPRQWYEQPADPPPRCYHCGEICTEDEWCSDCREPVCEVCADHHAELHAYWNDDDR